jgi:hypothetical protein
MDTNEKEPIPDPLRYSVSERHDGGQYGRNALISDISPRSHCLSLWLSRPHD